LKHKHVVLLLCLLLFVAAVDTIPDPPAINPPGSHNFGISALHFRGALTLLEKEWFGTSGSARNDCRNWISERLAFDTKPAAVVPPPLVRHAADVSPPAFS
jgi:hypothetical protein